MATLTNETRAILRSRLRRHPQGPAAQGVDVASLSNADLVQAGMLCGLDVPTDREATMLADLKIARGVKGKAAFVALDREAHLAGLGGAGLAAIVDAAGAAPATPDATEADPDDAEDGTDAHGTPEAEAETEADPVETEAAALVADVNARFGSGDFEGYRAALLDMARRAVAPPPAAPAPAYVVDPDKVRGHIPQVTGAKRPQDVGLSLAATADLNRITLDAYDAPDAPPVDPAYHWPEASAVVLAFLASGSNVFLTGPAGTGKTEFAKQVAARWGRPFVRISCDDQTEAATLTGMTVPDGNGGTKWQDGQLAAAIRRPGTVILIDEPSVARPGALLVLQAVLDGDRCLHVAETGETIPVAPGVIFLAADNTNGTGDETGQYEGTRRLNRAFLDRFAAFQPFDYLDATTEARVLRDRAGCAARTAGALTRFAALTRRKADTGEVSHGLGMRRLVALAKAINAGVEPDLAFNVSVLQGVPYDDREPLRQMWASDVRKDQLA